MQIINIHEGKTHFSKLISDAEAGQTTIIGRKGTPVAMIIPYSPTQLQPRKGGQWKGLVWMAPDFDEPDLEIERLFYEGDLLPGNIKPTPLR
jgi:prevent-host-death family protein